ncbi:hypothetical protein HPB52_016302 [Rhipicephalus sanguineus]|uniref:Uncharacterized protein n=1 Tax=Rhipicephalus sanguineus TaxID=34632 RepID=A0A9D4PS37_RHISA|nr:hypothetical protein HPB52_016302 [Rhipicephalus sanguineus]
MKLWKRHPKKRLQSPTSLSLLQSQHPWHLRRTKEPHNRSGAPQEHASQCIAFKKEEMFRDRIDTTTTRNALRTEEFVVLRRRRRKKAKTLSVRLKQRGSKPPNQRRLRPGNHRPRRSPAMRRGSGSEDESAQGNTQGVVAPESQRNERFGELTPERRLEELQAEMEKLSQVISGSARDSELASGRQDRCAATEACLSQRAENCAETSIAFERHGFSPTQARKTFAVSWDPRVQSLALRRIDDRGLSPPPTIIPDTDTLSRAPKGRWGYGSGASGADKTRED